MVQHVCTVRLLGCVNPGVNRGRDGEYSYHATVILVLRPVKPGQHAVRWFGIPEEAPCADAPHKLEAHVHLLGPTVSIVPVGEFLLARRSGLGERRARRGPATVIKVYVV